MILAFLLFLAAVTRLVVPKYVSSGAEGSLIAEYYATEKNHDVLFIGDCEIYESIIPATLWHEYGITSYARGSAQQLIWQSYYLLEEMLSYETPKAVVFNVLALKYGEPQNEAYNRMTLDGMKWSRSKIDAILASVTADETFISYVFPLLRYHSRWQEITAEDFQYFWPGSVPVRSFDGYMMQTEVVPKTSDRTGVQLPDYTLPAESMAWLEKMAALCREHGVTLLLMKAPMNTWKYWWYDEWDEQVSAWANENGIAYVNMIPMADEIGIDWSTDTYDGGVHLNVYGAEKLTSWLGALLTDEFGLGGIRHDENEIRLWNQKFDDYRTKKEEILS